MPDWSYQTVLQRALFRFPADRARRFTVGFFEGLARIPGGVRVVDALGHMQPAPVLRRSVGGLSAPSPVGLAPVIDPEGRAAAALSRFGVGWVTLGPVASRIDGAACFSRSPQGRGVLRHGPAALTPGALGRGRPSAPGVRVLVELRPRSGEDGVELIRAVAPIADVLVVAPGTVSLPLDPAAFADLETWSRAASGVGRPLWLGLPVDATLAAAGSQRLEALVGGLYLSGRPAAGEPGTWQWHEEDHGVALTALRERSASGPRLPVLVDAGTQSPRQALELFDSGADLVAVGAGLVHIGPGLPKRLNEALEHRATAQAGGTPSARPPERLAWLWGLGLGVAMGIGALMAIAIALTTVLLPYDEAYLGRTRDAIAAFNPRVLHFMTHDRLTLAGTMLSLAVIYVMLSLFGMRRGHHWAQRALTASALVGFLSFFSFLGFGYFDPFHAFVTVVLFQLFVQSVVLPVDTRRRRLAPPGLDNDRTWRMAQWGQFAFVLQAVGLLCGGATILAVGMSSVFVSTDVAFLGMSAHDFHGFDRQLVPLIAHDRVTFGGMLLSGGTALLLTTLWSHRAGDRWLWWTYLLTVLPPYLMTLGIHFRIGYTDFIHLAPVYLGILLMAAGLALNGPYLLRSPPPR